MSNHFTFFRSFKVTLVTFTCIFTHAFLQITSCVDFKAMLVTFNFTFLRVSPQITCRKGFKVAVVKFEFICFMSIQITSRRTFKVTWSKMVGKKMIFLTTQVTFLANFRGIRQACGGMFGLNAPLTLLIDCQNNYQDPTKNQCQKVYDRPSGEGHGLSFLQHCQGRKALLDP